jgi:hypothetical protein
MAQNDQVNFDKQCTPTNREAKEVKESIEKNELQNSILRLLVKEIRKPDTTNNTDEECAGLKEKSNRTC